VIRNIGPITGISLVIFLLMRNSQIVHAELPGYATPGNSRSQASVRNPQLHVTALCSAGCRAYRSCERIALGNRQRAVEFRARKYIESGRSAACRQSAKF